MKIIYLINLNSTYELHTLQPITRFFQYSIVHVKRAFNFRRQCRAAVFSFS